MHRYTSDEVRSIYREIHRRLNFSVMDGSVETQSEYLERRNVMMQGVYSALMVTASNWPEVVSWLSALEVV